MSEKSKKNKKARLNLSNKQFEKILMACLLIGIIFVAVFIGVNILTPEEGFVIFGVLNENQEAENYPTNATVGENVSFFINVENHLSRDFSFYVKVLKGDNNTVLNATGGNGVLNDTTSTVTLNAGQQWMSANLSISFWNVNDNLKIIIFELWENLTTDKIYNILWLRLNITT